MGVDEPTEFRCDSSAPRLRRERRTIRNASTQVAKMAKNPRTTMTAIAQAAKPEPPLFDCTLPVAVGVPVPFVPLVPSEFEAPVPVDVLDVPVVDEDSVASTESAYVVSIKYK